MTSKKRTHKMEKLARIYDDEILPVWTQRFGRMLLRGLDLADKAQILDVACGTGFPATEILRRMEEGSRLIAIDGASPLLDVARRKVKEMREEGLRASVFFRSESASPKLSFADDVYDLVVCNLGLAEMPSPEAAVADFARVTQPGGEVRCTLPLEGTFQEFYDIFREVLIKHDKHESLNRLNQHLAEYPTPEDCAGWLANAGLVDTRVEVEEFSMLFKSSREFFFAPVIEFGPLAAWKEAAGRGQEMQDVFWYIKEAIDAYFGGRAFEVTVQAGCLIGTVPTAVAEEEVVVLGAPMNIQDDELDISTEEIDLADIEELATDEDEVETLDGAKPVHEVEDEDVVIEAFVEGSRRPSHLDED